MTSPRAVALFSGGLDSMLAVRILQLQGFEIEALNVRTTFSCCRAMATEAATRLNVRLTAVEVDDDYLDVIRNPMYGYGKGANPCIDCRIYMCRMAKQFADRIGAAVVVTGEIAGQRPMSQKKHHLEIVARRSGLEGRLLRPLSAKLLDPTDAERSGLVDREKLYAFHGRARRPLLDLAQRLGIAEVHADQLPSPSTGCALTESLFAPRVHDLLQYDYDAQRWSFELLNRGRHIRLNAQTKLVVGRNADENATLCRFAERQDAPNPTLLDPENFRGPHVLVVGEASDDALRTAAALMVRYARPEERQNARVRVIRAGRQHLLAALPCEKIDQLDTL